MLADSSEVFYNYGGFELLRELFRRHKDLCIAKALAYIIELRCNNHQ